MLISLRHITIYDELYYAWNFRLRDEEKLIKRTFDWLIKVMCCVVLSPCHSVFGVRRMNIEGRVRPNGDDEPQQQQQWKNIYIYIECIEEVNRCCFVHFYSETNFIAGCEIIHSVWNGLFFFSSPTSFNVAAVIRPVRAELLDHLDLNRNGQSLLWASQSGQLPVPAQCNCPNWRMTGSRLFEYVIIKL